MNILILSCGTRNKLVEFFRGNRNFDRVIVTDCSEQAPALYAADKYYIVPRMEQEGYLDCILDICRKESIELVLPLQEEELLLTAKNKAYFQSAGVFPIVSDYEKVVLCKDKYALNNRLMEQGIPAVPSVSARDFLAQNTEMGEMFVKPRYGAGSVNTSAVRSRKLLEALVGDTAEELIVQPRLKGKEFGADVYVDFNSHEVITVFCKQKLRMRAGETEKSLSVLEPAVEKLAADAVMALGLCGPLDVDILEQDGNYYILEINPRFGGGYPHAYLCGVSFPEYLARNGRGETNTVNRNNYPANTLAMKYSEIILK